MTAPGFPQLPNVQLGNTASDISSAVSSFAKGLQQERTRRREQAMSEALMNLKMQEFLHPRPIKELQQTPEGTFNVYRNPRDVENELYRSPAPESQYFFGGEDAAGNLTTLSAPRYAPNAPAKVVQLPPGQKPRSEPLRSTTIETPQGPRVGGFDPRTNVVTPSAVAGGGGPAMPKADEADERRARDAFEMVQGQYEMSNALKTNPKAYDEAARYAASLDIGEGIPLVGNFVQALIRQSQNALSPEASSYFNGLMNFAAARAFSRGGATLTRNEIDYSLSSLAPKPFEAGETLAGRQRLVNGLIGASIAGNNAWQRYREAAKQFGFDESMTGLTPPVQSVQPTNRLTGRPRRH